MTAPIMIALRAAALALAPIALYPAARAQQDQCQDAGLSGFGVSGSLSFATIDGSSTCQPVPYPDLWWSYRPLTSGILVLGVCSDVPFAPSNLLLSVHSGCPGTVLNELFCNDDNPAPPCIQPHAPSLTMPVTAGTTYIIRVSSADGSAGPVHIGLNSGPPPIPPPNISAQTACAVAPGIVHGNSFHTTPNIPSTIWFSYTPATTGMAVADTCGLTGDDTVLLVIQGSTFVGYSDDSCGNYQSSVSWPAIAGVEYQIAHSFFFDMESPLVMRLTGPPAAQEDCATAPTIGDGVHWLSFENATAQGASSCDPGGVPDVFYRYFSPDSGVLTVSTLGSDDGEFPDAGEDTLVSLHSGCPATSANTIVCNDTAPPNGLDAGALADASVRTLVHAGQVIVIRVARVGPGQPDSNFPVRLSVDFAPVDFTTCPGDGTATACPCANSGTSGHGCAGSQDASGAQISGSGQASISNDTFTLHGTHMPASGTALYVQGTAANASGSGTQFGDGLRCVAGTIVRLGVRTSSGGASIFGFADGAHVSVAGQIPPAGGARVYQVWYRDAAPFCTSALFNLSNGISISWGP